MEGIEICDDEVGYIALHIHSAIEDEKISQAIQTARIVRQCVSIIEEKTGQKIDTESLAYNRLTSHVKYMVVRTLKDELIKLDMNDYIKERFPNSFKISEDICNTAEKELKKSIHPVEIGYLAMHIERIFPDEMAE